MPGLDLSVYHYQNPDRPWEVESLRARRAWIEEQRLAEPFGLRLMPMTKDADIRLDFLEQRSSALCEFPPSYRI